MFHFLMDYLLIFVVIAGVFTQSLDDISADKRAMRNALVRFGRASGGMRNALVRFGKRAIFDDDVYVPANAFQNKRNGAPQPFVRFGRSVNYEDN